MNFWDRVKELLEKQHSSFRYLADVLGTNESTISTWRSRSVLPRADEAVKIARALGTTVEYLITGEEPAENTKYEELKEAMLKIMQKY